METAQRLLELNPDMPSEDRQLWQDCLEAESAGDPFQTLDKLVHAAVQHEHYAEGVRAFRRDLDARYDRHMTNAERARDAVHRFLDALQLTTLVRPTYSASISSGRVHVVPTKEPAEMPPRFQRVSVAVNKVALTEALKSGEEGVPAEWSNAEPTLTIRVR